MINNCSIKLIYLRILKLMANYEIAKMTLYKQQIDKKIQEIETNGCY